jgi:hypothetical protein
MLTIAAIVWCLFGRQALWAADYSTDITDFALIGNPDVSEAPRALLRFDLPQDLSGKTVRTAKLLLPVSFALGDSELANLSVWPLATGWTPDNVGWDNPWNQSGGDVADSSYVLYPVDDASSRVIEIDISGIASAWAQGWYANNGVMVMSLEPDVHYFYIEDNGDWPSGVRARVEITYEE